MTSGLMGFCNLYIVQYSKEHGVSETGYISALRDKGIGNIYSAGSVRKT
jgi:hypothetical protein